jgi:regulator of nucleoside diphosphate kinase
MNTMQHPIQRPLIVVAEGDARRLAFLLGGTPAQRDAAHLRELRDELERALVVPTDEMPADVITMHSAVGVLDLENATRQEVTLVYPHAADPARGHVSVLAPLGTALLGYRVGDEISWTMPGGRRRLRIETVRNHREDTVCH